MARLALATIAVLVVSTSDSATSSLPARLESYLAHVVQLTAEERGALLGGTPITRLLPGDETREVAVFGAIWIAAPIKRYVYAITDIENFERGGGFRVTKRVNVPPRLDDFAGLRLSDEDIEDLRTCRVGDCDVKLSARSLARFRREVNWGAPNARDEADALMRQVVMNYVTDYLDGGNERLPVYRDHRRPIVVGTEFRALVDQMPGLTTYMPAIRRYLLEFPKVTLPDATSFLYWQDTDFGLKPTIRVSHVTIRETPEDTVVVSKMIYATHYFLSGIELRALLPDPARGQGFWFVTVSRSRLDGLSGMRGLFVRPRVRSAVQDGALSALLMTKRRLER